jgi:hypothetical protein
MRGIYVHESNECMNDGPTGLTSFKDPRTIQQDNAKATIATGREGFVM